jgi:hypothetical protein
VFNHLQNVYLEFLSFYPGLKIIHLEPSPSSLKVIDTKIIKFGLVGIPALRAPNINKLSIDYFNKFIFASNQEGRMETDEDNEKKKENTSSTTC